VIIPNYCFKNSSFAKIISYYCLLSNSVFSTINSIYEIKKVIGQNLFYNLMGTGSPIVILSDVILQS